MMSFVRYMRYSEVGDVNPNSWFVSWFTSNSIDMSIFSVGGHTNHLPSSEETIQTTGKITVQFQVDASSINVPFFIGWMSTLIIDPLVC